MAADDSIDQLYRLPLGEFTAARNALAKGHREGAAIKQLEKPSVPAWAVNQLYWGDRAVYDAVVAASEELRAAHRKVLSGKDADLRDAEKRHREAVRAAVERAREILTAAGQATTQQTMTAVSETLEALPSTTDGPGRLVRPLRPAGFEALAGIASGPARGPADRGAGLRLVAGRRDSGDRKRDEAEQRRAAERAKQEAEEEEKRRKAAEREVRQAAAAEARARSAVEKAQRDVERRESDLAAAREALDRARRTLKEAAALHERARLRAGS